MANATWIMNVGEADFQREVIERSREIPIVVDFWAEWCPPCRMLGPVLESLVQERAGAGRVGRLQASEQRGIEERCDARRLTGDAGASDLAEDAGEVGLDQL